MLRGAVTEADFAADLAQVITGGGNPEYRDPDRFFANTHRYVVVMLTSELSDVVSEPETLTVPLSNVKRVDATA